jgi:hypothetical protein
MTINVTVKCPDGIVMGADSLLSILKIDGSVGTIIPYFSKLFPIGPVVRSDVGNTSRMNISTADVGSRYAAGAMINGAGHVAGRTLEDIIEEFGETNPADPKNYDLRKLTEELAQRIQMLIDDEGEAIALELIVGGYSKGEAVRTKRYGEIYSVLWEQAEDDFKHRRYELNSLYSSDTEFGTFYSGQFRMLDRFMYGTDEWIISDMFDRSPLLFDQTRDYICKKLEESGIKGITEDLKKSIRPPENLDEVLLNFNIYQLMSDFDPGKNQDEIIKNVMDGTFLKRLKIGMVRRLRTPARFFSLQTAVNYCSFLMWCSYAESAFTNIIPRVGSEARIATITRHEGFRFRKIWEIQSPGPPFR